MIIMPTHSIALTLAFLTPALPLQESADWLYAQTGNGLQVYDAQSGNHLSSTHTPELINNAGLAFDGGRLYTMNQNLDIRRDFMVEIHPATSRYVEIGNTGLSIPWFNISLVRDPTTDVYYVQAADEVYQADMHTGKLTYLCRLEQGVTIISAIAINALGEVYGYSTPNVWHVRPAIFRVDLRTGELDLIGDLEGPQVSMRTLAFDSSDRLWGAGDGPFTSQAYRLYRIDLETFELQPTFPLWDGAPWARAIAFGPAPDVSGYCEAKSNSEGCAPTVTWKGHPSASAHFGFTVSGARIVPDSPGFLMLGLGGQADLPFQGGTLCVGEPILRTTPQASGGSGACTGAWSLDVNTWLFKHHPLAPGDRFTCQWWGRDPGLTGRDSAQLSDALEVVLLP